MTSRPTRNRPSYAGIFQPIFSDEEKFVTDVVGEPDSEAGSIFDPLIGPEGGHAAESPFHDLLDKENDGTNDEGGDSGSVISMGTVLVLREGSQPRKQGGTNVAPNLPSKDHRHRPNGLWAPPADVYRLLSPPIPFSKPEVIRTNSADHPAVMQRVKKAWTHSSGTGPVWELLEDRAFFKEEWIDFDLSSRKGRKLRPVVFPTVRAEQLPILSREGASRYLPHDKHDISTINVSVGPVESQSTHHLGLFDSLVLEQVERDAQAHLLFTGGPVSALDWCPTSPEELRSRNGAQYLALAPLPSLDHRTTFYGIPPSPSCIQFWSISRPTAPGMGDKSQDTEVSCQLVACIEDGPVKDLKWTPLPSHGDASSKGIKKLGVLGAITEPGDFCLYIIPYPHDLLKPNTKEASSEPVFFNLSPAVRLRLPGTHCTCFDWANGDSIAVGCSNGFVAIYHITSTAFTGADITPSHYFPVHQNCIRSISWVRVPPCDSSGQFHIDEDPAIIFTAGVEGIAMVTDTRDLLPRIVVRNREIPYSTSFSSMTGCIIASDTDYWIKVWQVGSAFLGRGHNLLDTGGSALRISCSDLHPYAAIGSADGSCTTANQLRSTRREAVVPLFNHKVFQLEYSKKTGTYRMLDHFLPFETGAGDGKAQYIASGRQTENRKEQNQTRYSAGIFDGSALWPHEVSVLSTCWNSCNGLENAPWLASGTISGLVRIDWLQGRWFRDTVPYTGISNIRFEGQSLEGQTSDSE